MWYALGENATTAPAENLYTTSIPTATNVGTYYVWYKVVGDENHNDSEASCITVTVSQSSGRSSSRSSSSSASSGSATSGSTSGGASVTVPVSGEDNTVSVSVTISDDTATVSNADIETVLSETEETGTVTIDVSNVGTEITEAVIPAAMVEKITEAVTDVNNDADGLEVKLSTGTVTFDSAALEAISEQMTGSDLRLNLDSVGESTLSDTQQTATVDLDVQAVYDVYMTSNGQRISDFKGGSATVAIGYALKAGQRAAGIVVWHVADNGERTEMPSTYDGRDVRVKVGHFSNYVIAYDESRITICPKDFCVILTEILFSGTFIGMTSDIVPNAT